jgi:hypothetical protein
MVSGSKDKLALGKTGRIDFGGHRRPIWNSIAAFVALLMPVAAGYAQTIPAANAADEHSGRPPRWTERAHPELSYYNRLPEGGRFRCVGAAGVFRRRNPRGASITAPGELRGHP